MTKSEIQEKLTFHRAALKALREAYLALAEGGVKQYTIGSRSLTKLDLDRINEEIKGHEKAIAELDAALSGRKRRRAVAVLPRDW